MTRIYKNNHILVQTIHTKLEKISFCYQSMQEWKFHAFIHCFFLNKN